MMDAPSDVKDFLASRPTKAYIANLFTFVLLSGPVYRYTDWRRPLSVGVNIFSAGPPRLVRGTIRVERGVAVSTQKIEIQEANAEIIGMLARGYFNRAIMRMERIFAADNRLQWTSAVTKFFGRIDSIDAITRTSATLTVKSMLDDLDNDYPRFLITPDCNAVLFDDNCGLSSAAYIVSGTVSAGSTKISLLSGLTNADDYFTQGVLTFTSGDMSGISYLVKQYKSDVVVPAYPLLVAPPAGTTFTITPGCDKLLSTCQSKYGYNPSAGVAPFFRGQPFVPDPTVTY
jgi:uncharacterized phage protein (TIGR02218 family)